MDSFTGSEDLFGTSDTDSDVTVDLSEPATNCESLKSSDLKAVRVARDSTRKESALERVSVEQLRPLCKYGEKCYRKNPSHLAEFRHPEVRTQDSQSSGRAPECNSRSNSPSSKRQRLNPVSDSQGTSTSKDLSGYEQRSSQNVLPKDVIRPQCADDSVYKCAAEIIEEAKPLSFLLTKVSGIDDRLYNSTGAIDIRDILCSTLGELQRSAQFNYCIDIPWVVSRYPKQFRSKPLLIVHGAKGAEKTGLDVAASRFSNVRLCQAPLEIAYGTHHTKMMFLEYDVGLRVVIHTANLVEGDWHQKTQGVWVSDLYPRLSSSDVASSADASMIVPGDSPTKFKQDLLAYLSGYGRQRLLEEWITVVKEHDMSSTRVFLIGSVPGRHMGQSQSKFGHLKLRQILQSNVPQSLTKSDWPVIGQFSSVGTLGATADSWMCGELLESLSSAAGGLQANKTPSSSSKPKLKLIFPTADNVRCSLEGYMAGGSIPYSLQTAKKQPYFNTFLHQWRCGRSGRSRASPHIKTYARVSPDSQHMAWFLVTSANMSKAAWGALEKNGQQLMIRSYELGVLFLPQRFGTSVTFNTSIRLPMTSRECSDGEEIVFPVPYDLPLIPYTKEDRPWIWDIAYTDKPDSLGNQWSPP